MLKSTWLNTPLVSMFAIADDQCLYLLEFAEKKHLEREIKNLCMITRSTITPGITDPIISIEKELTSYFAGTLKVFKTPLYFMGTSFQKRSWQDLMRISYGETKSYAEQAIAIGKPSACRAVANANGANQLAIVIPCHRIINSNGDLGGYSGGIANKKWLLSHEKKNK